MLSAFFFLSQALFTLLEKICHGHTNFWAGIKMENERNEANFLFSIKISENNFISSVLNTGVPLEIVITHLRALINYNEEIFNRKFRAEHFG